MLAAILTESEDARTVHNTTHNYYETLQVSNVIDSDIDSYEDSKCDMEYSYFIVVDE